MNKISKIRITLSSLLMSFGVMLVYTLEAAAEKVAKEMVFAQSTFLPQGTSEHKCIQLFPRNEIYQDAAIVESGSYCLNTDFRQRRMSGGGHSGPGRGHALIRVHGGDVVIDLQRYTLHSGAMSNGIIAYSQRNIGWAESEKRDFGHHTVNITIRNGVIDLRGIGTGIELINQWNMVRIDEQPPTELAGYEKTRFILENLTIKTDNVGIILEGDGNIIRNCIIESGGDANIMMAGPNGQILNNRIVLLNPFIPTWLAVQDTGTIITKLFEFKKMARAAIVLHQASNTVVRGNRIEVRDKSTRRHSIYIRNSSKDVVIENNTFIGGIDPVVLLDGSTALIKTNLSEKEK